MTTPSKETAAKLNSLSISDIRERAEKELAVINVEMNREALRKARLENDYTEFRLEADRFQLSQLRKDADKAIAADVEVAITAPVKATRKPKLKAVDSTAE